MLKTIEAWASIQVFTVSNSPCPRSRSHEHIALKWPYLKHVHEPFVMLLYSWYLYIIHNFDYNIGFKWGGLQLVTACSLNSFKLFSKFTSRISPWLMLFEWYCDQYSYPVRDGWSTFRLKCGKQSPGWWVICHYPSLPTFLTWTISLAIYIYIMWQWNRVRFHRLII